MSDLSTFEQYYKLADQLVEKSSKDDIAECARLLALNVAHYQSKYGELPLEETLAMIGMNEPNEAQIQLMAEGMEILVGVLGSVCSGLDQPRHYFIDCIPPSPNENPGNRYRGLSDQGSTPLRLRDGLF